MKTKVLNNITVNNKSILNSALVRMSKWGFKTLVVVTDKLRYAGTLSDGDIRKSLIKGKKLSDKISTMYRKKTTYFYEHNYSIEVIKNFFLKKQVDIIPIVDKEKKLKKVYFQSDLSNLKTQGVKKKKIILNTSAIVMSGGKGTRLKPFTDVLPKPLMPFKGKTLIEHIVNNFIDYGIKDFIFSINYKSHLIKAFFKELNPSYSLKYIEEKFPLGTAGSLKMVEKTGSKYFFISNCDTIIQVDLHDLHKFHRVNKNDITIVVSNKKTKIPYGVCMTNKNKVFEEVVEKPELNHIVNTGFYLINSNVVDLVPKKSRTYNFTDLINRAKKLKKKIGIYSTKSKNWIDLGVPSVFQ